MCIDALIFVLKYRDLQAHTILLVQPGITPETRTYSDYESVNECMEGVCKIYEEHLKRRNPNTPTITYDISQLFDFVDQVLAVDNQILTNRNVFSFLVGRFELFGISEINEYLRTLQ